MYRVACFWLCLAASVPACADLDKKQPLQLAFNSVPDLSDSGLTSSYPSADIALTGFSALEPVKQSREQRRAARDRLLEALGISRFIPAGTFSAFGNSARWSVSMEDEDSVVLRMRMKW